MDTNTVQHLGIEYGQRFFAGELETASEAQAVSAAMVEQGLRPQFERTHVFNVFSPDSLKSVAISITPFNSKDGRREGGLSVSQGGHAQAVIVSIEGVELRSFTHIAVAEASDLRAQRGGTHTGPG